MRETKSRKRKPLDKARLDKLKTRESSGCEAIEIVARKYGLGLDDLRGFREPLTGKTTTLEIAEGQREVSDVYLFELRREAREQRVLTIKMSNALGEFREIVSAGGELTYRQRKYLASMVLTLEGTIPEETRDNHYEIVAATVRVTYGRTRGDEASILLDNLFGEGRMERTREEIRRELENVGVQDNAELVLSRVIARAFRVQGRELRRTFGEVCPTRRDVFSHLMRCGHGYSAYVIQPVIDFPRELRAELEGMDKTTDIDTIYGRIDSAIDTATRVRRSVGVFYGGVAIALKNLPIAS